MPNSGEYKSVIGLDSLYIAPVTQDDSGTYVAGTPVWFAPAAEATIEPTTNAETQYADNRPFEAMTAEGETTVNLTVTGIPASVLADVLGKKYDATTGRTYDNKGTPPYYALGMRSKKSNGAYRYFWFLKGRFQKPSEAAATSTDAPDPKTTQISFTAIFTEYKFDLGGSLTDSVMRVMGDSDSDNFSGTTWFSAVQTPVSGSASAIALSTSVPANNATAIVVSANQVLTFNNRLNPASLNGVVLTTAEGVAVATVRTLDATGKIMTIDPTGSLTAATIYLLTYSVTDVYGQTLSNVIKFTTA